LLSLTEDHIVRTIETLTLAFHGDPVFAWILLDYPPAEQLLVLPKLFRGFLTACALSHGIFTEVDDFGCCGIIMPPGMNPATPGTMLRAGLIPSLFDLGFGCWKVSIPLLLRLAV
jgi:hypothetical protein